MASILDARVGLWQDYSRPFLDQRQLLETDFWLRWLTAFVAVSLTVIGPCVFKISRSFLIFLLLRFSQVEKEWRRIRGLQWPSSQNMNPEQDPLRPGLGNSYQTSGPDNNAEQSSRADSPYVDNHTGPNGAIQGQSHQSTAHEESPITVYPEDGGEMRLRNANDNVTLAQTLGHSENSRGLVFSMITEVEKPRIATVVIATVLFGLFVAQAIAGTFSGKIASDRVGLSSSVHCGIWQFDVNAGEEAADRDDLDNHRKEARASQYARNCYNSRDTTSTLSCKIFYNQSIGYETRTDQRCPFNSSELCNGGLYSAVTFDTGLVDASIIGINAAPTYKFRRNTTCSPLNMSEPYIRRTSSGENENSYRYFYGAKENSEYTFNTSGHPFEWLVPAYSVNTYFSSLYPKEDYWHPIPELGTPANRTLTIMFITSMHVYHTQRTEDPIFNATTPRYFPGLRDPYYYSSDDRARVLACVDQSMVCSPEGDTCWSMTSPAPPAAAADPAYWLMKWSLENSDTYDAIKWRLGNALLAQERISQFVSNPLSPQQWQLEASALFATSLATIQYDTLGIATGEDRNRPGYLDVTPDEARGRLCGRYKFKTEDYTNVNFAAFLGLPALALAIFVLSWDWRTLSSWRRSHYSSKRRSQENESWPGSEPLVIDVIAHCLCGGIVWVARGIYKGARIGLIKLKNLTIRIYNGAKTVWIELEIRTTKMMRKRESGSSNALES